MGVSVTEVVKVIQPIALSALADAAAELLVGTARENKIVRRTTAVGANSEEDGNTIWADTSNYVELKFGDIYGYSYAGLTSAPPDAVGPLLGAVEDIIVWNPALNETTSIQRYMQTVLRGTLPDQDLLLVSKNLAEEFEARFKLIELSWTPFNKRYDLKKSKSTMDLMMVTSAGYDSAQNPMGIATYCFTIYKTA